MLFRSKMKRYKIFRYENVINDQRIQIYSCRINNNQIIPLRINCVYFEALPHNYQNYYKFPIQ